METIVIVGGSREAARERLKLVCDGNRIKRLQWYDESQVDGHRIWAMGGEKENVCFPRSLGLQIEKFIIVEPDGISEEMGKHINYVRSTIRQQLPHE